MTTVAAVATHAEERVRRLRELAGAVPDPEIPVLTLDDLGIVRDLVVRADGVVEVTLTPTYTGCPATAVIAADVESALRGGGATDVEVRTVLSPAWTTDWMSDAGRERLRAFGIAPPGRCAPSAQPSASGPTLVTLTARCPRCGSVRSREISRFGSTPCTSLWACRDCAEPFDSFKAI
ncbi:MAG: phenylacetate-CoA oxygenase, PaaJ subunit [Actinotalea sp.]|nr:phenylacetate-CoA oxygenase, PaaJ subunit [Actinotalea sp.]